jgi:hypothetical protein
MSAPVKTSHDGGIRFKAMFWIVFRILEQSSNSTVLLLLLLMNHRKAVATTVTFEGQAQC